MSKQIKKVLSLLLAVTLLFGAAPLTAVQAADPTSGTCGANLTWSYNTSTKTLTISGTGAMYSYDDIFTDGYDAYFTTAPWHPYYDTMKKVVIGAGVTSIGRNAFYGCVGLTSVTVPNSVTSIGDGAFYNCTGLTTITVAADNPNYSSDAYGVLYNKNKTELIHYPVGNARTAFTIPNSVTSIGRFAFHDCTGLTSVTIPNSVTSIGDEAFRDCTGLTSVTIPKSVTSIGDLAFFNCTGLTAITVAADNPNYSSDAYGVLYNKNKTELIQYPVGSARAAFTISNSVTSIGEVAFCYCTSLTSVTIGNSVTSIGVEAFSCCTGLTSVTIGNSVTSIDEYAFNDCTGLTSVTIPNSVTSIGTYAFAKCSGLTRVTIGNSVTSIDWGAFWHCTGLTSVTIPDSVTSIGDLAFEGCAGLMNVTIGNSVTSIGKYAFYDCTGLTSVTIGNSVTSIGQGAFSGCPSLTSVTIPASVTSIGDWAFKYCTNLTYAHIPSSVTSIGDSAFDECASSFYICSDTSSCYANTYAAANGIGFRLCSGHAGSLTLTKIAVKTMPTKKTYNVDESFNSAGLTLTASYSDNSTKIISSGFTCSGFSSTTAGTKTVTLSYQGKTTTLNVEVINRSTYTVTYNANGGSVSPTSKTVTAGGSTTLPTPTKAYTITYSANGGTGAPSAQKLNLTCKGWATSSSATTASYSCGSQYTPTGSVTLYAVWNSSVSATLSSIKPTRDGYKFLGWATSSIATSATFDAGESVSVSGNVTLYAVWEADSGSSDSGSSSYPIVDIIINILTVLALPFIPLIAFIMTIIDLIF